MLSQGRLLDAMQMNALLMGLCAAFVGLIFRVAWRLWSRHVQPFSMSSWICWVAAGAVVSFWVLRNLPFPPFEWLAPSAHYVP
jgi:chromate transport protein ChrA